MPRNTRSTKASSPQQKKQTTSKGAAKPKPTKSTTASTKRKASAVEVDANADAEAEAEDGPVGEPVAKKAKTTGAVKPSSAPKSGKKVGKDATPDLPLPPRSKNPHPGAIAQNRAKKTSKEAAAARAAKAAEKERTFFRTVASSGPWSGESEVTSSASASLKVTNYRE